MNSEPPVIAALVEPLLEVLVKEARCDAAYLYLLREESLELAAWTGAALSAPAGAADLGARGRQWLLELQTRLVAESAAARDWRLRCFPEFLSFPFESALSIALRDSRKLLGVLNLCRFQAGGFLPRELASVARLSRPIATLIALPEAPAENCHLASEVERIRRKLDDRKFIDRAKGVLQQNSGCTEEVAYYTLRRTSRSLRQPMRSVAEFVIQRGRLPESRSQAL